METLGVNMTTRQFFFHPLALGGRDRDPSRFSLRRRFCPRISRRRPSPSRLAGDAPIVVVWLPLLLSVRLLVSQSFASPCLLAETWWLLARSEACLEPESESRILTSLAEIRALIRFVYGSANSVDISESIRTWGGC